MTGDAIQAVLFDLDDTLYLENDYFAGGFRAVIDELNHRQTPTPRTATADLLRFHHLAREGVFDRASTIWGFPRVWIPDLIAVFREHDPEIQLLPGAELVLEETRDRYKIGLVTDGHADVQLRKIDRLGVRPWFESVIVADSLGREFWKPEPLGLLKCLEELDVAPGSAVYVGDNPDRDTQGARNAGMRAIRVRLNGGYFSDATSSEPADIDVTDLAELAFAVSSLCGLLR